MATLKQIAEEVGTSIAAVSYVLHGRNGEVGPELRKKIKRALRRHDYQKNAFVQALRSSNTRLIAVLLPAIQNSYFGRILDEIEKSASEKSYHVIITQTMSNYERFKAILMRLREFRVSGFIVALPSPLGDAQKDLMKIKIPVVNIDHPYELPWIHSVASDDFTGAKDAVRRLIALGHVRIGTIRTATTIKTEKYQPRFLGYKAALAEAGIPYRPELIDEGASNNSADAGLDAGRKLITARNRMSAFFAPSDLAAIGFAKAASEKGLSIPDDIALVGYANLDEGIYHTPPIATVEQHPEEIGRISANCIIDWIEQEKLPPKLTLVPTDFIERRSIGGPIATNTRKQEGRVLRQLVHLPDKRYEGRKYQSLK
ncbi:MAG: LacI family DNA-binding transcriptional regulator [Victivallales bacterium]